MSSQPSPSKRLRELAKKIPEENETRALIRQLAGKHVKADYPVAMLGSALIERALEAAILSRFVQLKDEDYQLIFSPERNGILADFGRRIRFAYALGLFGPDTYQDLKYISLIRNLFAHSPNLLDFEHPEIRNTCASFNHRNRLAPSFPRPKGINRSQGQYITACMRIAAAIRARIKDEAEYDDLDKTSMADQATFGGRLP